MTYSKSGVRARILNWLEEHCRQGFWVSLLSVHQSTNKFFQGYTSPCGK